jgi:hypothetical protein
LVVIYSCLKLQTQLLTRRRDHILLVNCATN